MQIIESNREQKLESLISCLTCKNKKIKCDRALQSCGYCSKRGIQCFYSNKSKGGDQLYYRLSFSKNSQKPKPAQERDKRGSKAMQNLQFKMYYNTDIPDILYKGIFLPGNKPEDAINTFISPIIPYGGEKLQTHLLLMLTTQIIQRDNNVTDDISDFLGKLKLGIYGGRLKFNIRIGSEWIRELFDQDLESNCIQCYFNSFHPMVPYISKYKYYTNIERVNPTLRSVIKYVGYSFYYKQHPELLKYLKNCALIELKQSMFKSNLDNCQALFIFSYHMLFQGLAKQSLVYFKQACLMASILGIHSNSSNLDEISKQERYFIRFVSYAQDSHLSSTLGVQSYYLYMAPKWIPLNPLYQTNPYSSDRSEMIRAECLCITIQCFTRWIIPSSNLMIKYSQLTSSRNMPLSTENTKIPVQILETLYKESHVNALDLYIKLSEKYNHPEELNAIRKTIIMNRGFYYELTLILNTQFSPRIDEQTGQLNRSTLKAIKIADSLYKITTENIPECLPMIYHYLSVISLFYIKLILNLSFPQLQQELKSKLVEVYKLFKAYQRQYNLPEDIIEVVETMSRHYHIKLQ
jgi:hypothetical protein